MINQKRSIWSWVLYDVGNSAFATVIMAGFFPVFFKIYWSPASDVTVSTAQLGLANALAGLLIGILAPILGAVADKGHSQKKFLIFFAYLGVLMTIALCWVQKGYWQLAAVLYVLGTIGFSGANIFYDSLLPRVAAKQKIDYVSALGYAMGYLGGGLLFAFTVWLVSSPVTFGLLNSKVQILSNLLQADNIDAARVDSILGSMSADLQYLAELGTENIAALNFEVATLVQSAKSSAIKISFFLVAIWWGGFTLPIFLLAPAPINAESQKSLRPVRDGFLQLYQTFSKVRQVKTIFLFLLAYWLYIDGVHTVIRMAVDYGMSLGFAYSDLILAILITQFIGFPSSILFGKLGGKIGPKKAIYVGIAVYLFVVGWGMLMTHKEEFYVLAFMIGLVQGGIQALSRSYYIRLIPQARTAEFYGFYNMIGKFAAVLGPMLMGAAGYLGQSSRIGIASIAILFICGAVVLYFVEEKKGDFSVDHKTPSSYTH